MKLCIMMEPCTEGKSNRVRGTVRVRFVTLMVLAMRDNGNKMKLRARASSRPKDSLLKDNSGTINLFEERLISTRRDSVKNIREN